MSFNVLVIEDERGLNETLRLHLADQGHTAKGAYTCRDGLRMCREEQPEIVLLDQQLPDGTGLDILTALRADPAFSGSVIMMTGIHDLELAIRAIQAGAFDFIYKPVPLDELHHVLNKVIEHRRALQRVYALQADAINFRNTGALVGRSKAMLQVSKEIALVAQSRARVLVCGETGTGKEMVARAIHYHSNRTGLFLPVNCAAIVDTLMESELFGHEKGAFTGAVTRKPGKFELADDGTLFLDEIGEMNLILQAKLLRVLQEGTFERLGGSHTLDTHARIIAATNRKLEDEVASGRFREDLLYRLNTVRIELPPLRHRLDDIPDLVTALIEKIVNNLHTPTPTFTADALDKLQSYDWPGNVRELENVLTQAILRARVPVITAAQLSLPRAVERAEQSATPNVDQLVTLDRLEEQHIRRVLEATNYHKSRSCEILGISRPALDRKITRYGLIARNGGGQ